MIDKIISIATSQNLIIENGDQRTKSHIFINILMAMKVRYMNINLKKIFIKKAINNF
jgi:hypothetical protein